jgi:hypothetical protein
MHSKILRSDNKAFAVIKHLSLNSLKRCVAFSVVHYESLKISRFTAVRI